MNAGLHGEREVVMVVGLTAAVRQTRWADIKFMLNPNPASLTEYSTLHTARPISQQTCQVFRQVSKLASSLLSNEGRG
jgi:hypothetical protein